MYPLVVIFYHPYSANSLITAGRVIYKRNYLNTLYRSVLNPSIGFLSVIDIDSIETSHKGKGQGIPGILYNSKL